MSNPQSTAIQYTFIGGEVHPTLYSRADWARRAISAKRIENAVVLPTSGVVKRGGFRYVYPSLSSAHQSTLVEFEFSDEQTYVLEFGEYEMRVFTRNGVVLDALGEEYRVRTPYSVSQAAELKYRQDHDVLYFTHVDVPPQRLTRHDHADWRWEWVFVGERAPSPQNLRIVSSGADKAWYVVTANVAGFGESAASNAVQAVHPDVIDAPIDGSFSELYEWLRARDNASIPARLRFYDMSAEAMIEFLIDCGYVDHGYRTTNGGKHWKHIKPGSSVIEEASWWPGELMALVRECLYACDMGWDDEALDDLKDAAENYIDAYDPGETASGVTSLAWDVVEGDATYRVYRTRDADGLRDSYRRLAEVNAGTYTDDNAQEGGGMLPAEQKIFDEADDYPGVVALFQQRLAYAGTKRNPSSLYMSKTGSYINFETPDDPEDDSAFKFRLSATRRNAVMDIVALQQLVVLTSAHEFINDISGALTPHNINMVPQSRTGASRISAVVVDNIILRVPRGRNSVSSLRYDLTQSAFASKDLFHAARHLVQEKKIVDIAFQQHPHNLLWVLFDDGTLASCTYVPDQEVLAWARHRTQGKILAIATVFNDLKNEQELWAVIRRTLPSGTPVQSIEVLENPLPFEADGGNLTSAFYVDSGLSGLFAEPVTTLDGLDHLEGMEVAVLADGNVLDRKTVADGRIDLERPSLHVHVGLPYECVVETLDLEVEEGTFRNANRAPWRIVAELYNTRELLYSVNDGAVREALLQRADTMGLTPPLFNGDKELVARAPKARGTRVRLASAGPVPMGVLSVILEVEVADP